MENITITKDTDNAIITIQMAWEYDIKTMWNMFLDASDIEKWWAPEPYKAFVIHNNLVIGGDMLYYMLSPEGDKHYCKATYKAINMHISYSLEDAFCDENGVINTQFPTSIWDVAFENDGMHTIITQKIQYKTAEDMNKIVEMGFEEGYKQGLQQLERHLQSL